MVLRFDTDDGMGDKARMGLIVLQSDETLENEMRWLLPARDLALYHSRIRMPATVSPETLATMEAELPGATGMLPEIDFDVIGYGCTSGATVIGPDGIASGIRKARKVNHVCDPISSVIASCRALGVQKLGFVTPYVANVSAAMRALLEENGLTIAAFASFEEGDDRVVARISQRSILSSIETVAAMAPCDAIFVSCTNLRVASIAEQAEQLVGVPVISSNLAMAWQMMRLAGVTPSANATSALFTV